MSCFLIAQINIHNQTEYDKYLEGFDEVFSRFKGEVLVVDDQVTILEGSWPYTRTGLIRFPDKKEAVNWYKSAEYQSLARYRWQASTSNIVLIENGD